MYVCKEQEKIQMENFAPETREVLLLISMPPNLKVLLAGSLIRVSKWKLFIQMHTCIHHMYSMQIHGWFIHLNGSKYMSIWEDLYLFLFHFPHLSPFCS